MGPQGPGRCRSTRRHDLRVAVFGQDERAQRLAQVEGVGQPGRDRFGGGSASTIPVRIKKGEAVPKREHTDFAPSA
jgi:hypothetical protein